MIHRQFCYSSTTLWKLNFPFPGKLANQNSMRKKDDKVGNKTHGCTEKEGGQREKKRERKR